MNVDTLTTRRRGLGAAVAVVLGLLLGAPAAAHAALSITASPATPRPGEPVRFSATGSCDGICAGWSWKVGTQTILATGSGAPDPVAFPGFSTPGVYKVTLSYSRLSILPPWSFDVVKDITVVANQDPAASFTVSPSAPAINQAVTFTDTSTDPEGDALTRAWDLDGDGQYNDGDGRTASRTFATRGAKTVRLKVTDGFGGESISTRTVTVANVAPSVAMNVTPTTVQTGEPVTFSAVGSDPDGGAVTYAWDLNGDGQYTDATTASPGSRTYGRAGTVTVGVRVTDDDGDPSTSTVQRTQAITVTNRPPSTPTITALPATAARGETVQLTAAATDPEGTTLTYGWDFNDDGDYSDASGATVSRTMPQAGVLAARVRATDADGASTPSARFSLTAGNRPPSASFTVSPAEATIGQEVTFTDTSADPDGQALVRSWDLGSGSFTDGIGATAARSFDTWGEKTIRLRVSDGVDAAIATRTVTVRNAPPSVSLTVAPATVATGAAVSFSAAASDPDGGAVTYAWDLDGDGEYDDSTAAAPPSRSYPRSGTRTIGVRVTDDDGDPGSSTVQRTQAVTVTNRPPSTPTITANPGPVARGASVQLVAAATDPEGTALAYAWDLDGDGAFTDATGPTVTRTMPESGVLAARVRVTDADAASAVSAPFTLTAPAVPDPPPPAPGPDPAPTPEPAPPPVTPAGDPGAAFVSDPPAAVPAPSPAPAPAAAGSSTKPASTRPATPRLIRPFPRVRIQGRLTRRGARFTRITVTAPRGTRVTAQCRGRGCPSTARRTIGRSGVLRLSALLRSYRSGTRITIRATRTGAIGKHTTIVVRRGRAPKRVDRCLRPGATVPTRCPAN